MLKTDSRTKSLFWSSAEMLRWPLSLPRVDKRHFSPFISLFLHFNHSVWLLFTIQFTCIILTALKAIHNKWHSSARILQTKLFSISISSYFLVLFFVRPSNIYKNVKKSSPVLHLFLIWAFYFVFFISVLCKFLFWVPNKIVN